MSRVCNGNCINFSGLWTPELHIGLIIAHFKFGTSAFAGYLLPHGPFSWRTIMTKLNLLGAAAILSAVIMTPAMAEDAYDTYTQLYPSANIYNPGGYRAVPYGAGPGYPYGYYGGRANDGAYAYYGDVPPGDVPLSRGTSCGPQPGATYLAPDGRWLPC
jgi:hypothetical protein